MSKSVIDIWVPLIRFGLQKSSISHPKIIDFESKMEARRVPGAFAAVEVLRTAPGRVPRLTFV